MKERNELDTVLLTRYAAGDKSAFDALYAYYAPLLRTWAVATLEQQNCGYAADIVQQVFNDLHAGRHKKIPYLRGHLHNLLHDVIANHKKYAVRQKRDPTREIRDYDVAVDDNQVERNELLSLVNRLPERERNCILQVYLAGRSCHEYATEINTHFNNVIRWTRKGVKQLRAYYRESSIQIT